MFGIGLLIGFASVTILSVWFWRKNPHPNFPPGPKGLPFVGVLPFVGQFIQRKFKQWSQDEYGPIMSVRLGSTDMVILNKYECIHEAFVKKSPKFAGRPLIQLFQDAQGPYGLLLLNYPDNFSVQKQFGLSVMKKLGMGGKVAEEHINEELDHLVTHLSNKTNKPADLRWDFYSATTNVIAKLSFGKRFKYDDPVYAGFLKTLQSKLVDPTEAMLIFVLTTLPILGSIPPFSGAKDRFVQRFADLHKFIGAIVEEHKSSFNKNDLKDFIDYFIYEETYAENPEENRFIDRQLIAYIRDLFGGGAETTGVELYWAFLCLLRNPEIHKDILEEIERELEGKPASYQVRHKMPLTCAFLEEVWRISTPITKSITHQALEDVELSGFTIPKGTEIESNQWGSNHDPETFPDPMTFDPHRHIDEEGNFIVDSKVIALGIGMRRCIGTELAKMEVFLIFVGLLQNFEVSSPDNQELPTLYDTNKGLTNNPKDYKITLKKLK